MQDCKSKKIIRIGQASVDGSQAGTVVFRGVQHNNMRLYPRICNRVCIKKI